MIRLRLYEADRIRLGCPEWLDVDPGAITNREAVELRDKLGFATPGLLRRRLAPQPVLDANGEKILDDDGNPVEAADLLAWTGFVWVALRHAGIHVDLAELEFAYEAVDVEVSTPAEPVEEPGKAESKPSTRSTRRS